jgi:predicted DNA-binding antitoxin AbrB/MazE fold protein
MLDKAKTTKSGTVEKLVKPMDPREPEKAQINIHDAEPLYQEIRIDNSLKDADGNDVQLKEGAEVEVHIEADVNATTAKR